MEGGRCCPDKTERSSVRSDDTYLPVSFTGAALRLARHHVGVLQELVCFVYGLTTDLSQICSLSVPYVCRFGVPAPWQAGHRFRITVSLS